MLLDKPATNSPGHGLDAWMPWMACGAICGAMSGLDARMPGLDAMAWMPVLHWVHENRKSTSVPIWKDRDFVVPQTEDTNLCDL